MMANSHMYFNHWQHTLEYWDGGMRRLFSSYAGKSHDVLTWEDMKRSQLLQRGTQQVDVKPSALAYHTNCVTRLVTDSLFSLMLLTKRFFLWGAPLLLAFASVFQKLRWR